MSISGLHITMFAWLAGLGARRGLAAQPPGRAGAAGAERGALGRARRRGRLRGLLRLGRAGAAHDLDARRGLPAAGRRRCAGRGRWCCSRPRSSSPLLDPWALLQPGFWLSFAAVGLLMASTMARPAAEDAGGRRARRGRRGRLGVALLAAARRAACAPRLVATLGLTPLTLVFFQQVSLVGLLANLVAIPVVTLAVTPLALLGTLAPPLWSLGGVAVQGLDALLALLAAPARRGADGAGGAALGRSSRAWPAAGAGDPAAAVARPPAGAAARPAPCCCRRGRCPPRAASSCSPPTSARAARSCVRTRAPRPAVRRRAAVLARERRRRSACCVPLLRARGDAPLDLLVLSHRDVDHVGGAGPCSAALGVEALSSSLEAAHPLPALAARGVPLRGRPALGLGRRRLRGPAAGGRRLRARPEAERAVVRDPGRRRRAQRAPHRRHRARAGGAAGRRAWQRPAERRPDRAAPRQQDLVVGGLPRRGAARGRGGAGRLSQPLRPSGGRGAGALSRARHRGWSTARRAAPGTGPPRRQSTTPPASARRRAATGMPARPRLRRDRRRDGVSSAIFVAGRAIAGFRLAFRD